MPPRLEAWFRFEHPEYSIPHIVKRAQEKLPVSSLSVSPYASLTVR